MLPKKNKLTREDFKVLSKGRSIHSPYLTLLVYTKTQHNNPKISFVVSKKITKRSVIRNKLKRWGYAIIKDILENIPPNTTSVFFLKKGSEKLSYKEFESFVVALLKKAHLLS